jgi:threonine synthase
VVTGNGLKDIANAINAAGQPLLLPPDIDRLAGEFQRAGWLA